MSKPELMTPNAWRAMQGICSATYAPDIKLNPKARLSLRTRIRWTLRRLTARPEVRPYSARERLYEDALRLRNQR